MFYEKFNEGKIEKVLKRKEKWKKRWRKKERREMIMIERIERIIFLERSEEKNLK